MYASLMLKFKVCEMKRSEVMAVSAGDVFSAIFGRNGQILRPWDPSFTQDETDKSSKISPYANVDEEEQDIHEDRSDVNC